MELHVLRALLIVLCSRLCLSKKTLIILSRRKKERNLRKMITPLLHLHFRLPPMDLLSWVSLLSSLDLCSKLDKNKESVTHCNRRSLSRRYLSSPITFSRVNPFKNNQAYLKNLNLTLSLQIQVL